MGRQTYVLAWKSLTHGSANMDMLISVGNRGVLAHRDTGHDMTFHLTGRYVETTAKERVSQAIRKLTEEMGLSLRGYKPVVREARCR